MKTENRALAPFPVSRFLIEHGRMRLLLALPLILALFATAGCQTTNPTQKSRADVTVDVSRLYARDTERHQLLYYFQHRLLPYLWTNFPRELAMALEQYGASHLEQIMGMAQDDTGIRTEERFHYEVHRLKLDGEAEGWLLLMPEPVTVPECSYIALIYDGERIRFFTHELGGGPDDVIWFFCEWEEGVHFNYGFEADPSSESFIRRVIKAVSPEREEPAATSDLYRDDYLQ